jgi:hypothetical protein
MRCKVIHASPSSTPLSLFGGNLHATTLPMLEGISSAERIAPEYSNDWSKP